MALNTKALAEAKRLLPIARQRHAVAQAEAEEAVAAAKWVSVLRTLHCLQCCTSSVAEARTGIMVM